MSAATKENVDEVLQYISQKVEEIERPVVEVIVEEDEGAYNNDDSAFEIYKLDKNGLVVDVMSMSSGNSAFNISNLMNNNFNKMDDNYFNDFSKKRLKAVKILENYSTNLVANSFMNANERIEFGKKLKEVSEMEIAHDIEKNTNYRVNDRVYDTIMTCVYDMGQNLERNF